MEQKKKIFLNKGYCSLGGTPETCKFNPDIDHAYKYWDKSLNDCVINVNYYFGKNSLFFLCNINYFVFNTIGCISYGLVIKIPKK